MGDAIGGIVGVLAGLLIGSGREDLASRSTIAVAGAFAGAAIGILIGSLVGMREHIGQQGVGEHRRSLEGVRAVEQVEKYGSSSHFRPVTPISVLL